jgi:glycine/D-amino acid oxidase-like deaminating enzyme/nitrite reductase/ring-hydroxylating ferredoxin subunit
MDTTSYWLDSAQLPAFPSLTEDLTVDVAVIGAGMTGITAAYLLKKAGYRVAVIERERCGTMDSGHTTAHLTCVTDERLHKLVAAFGKEPVKATWEAGLAAIDQINATIRAEKIDCEFKWVPAYLHAAPGSDLHAERNALQKDAELANALGIRAEFMEAIPSLGLPGVKFFHQAKFHPLKYLSALLLTIPGNGSGVFEHTVADAVTEEPLAVEVGRNRVKCRYVILATHTPLLGKTNLLSATLFQTKLALYTTYVVGAKIPPGVWPEASFWDTAEPYHYLRIDRRSDFDYAILGGQDHKTGQQPHTLAAYQLLEEHLQKLIPKAKVDHRWSGQVIETIDGLPFIGETSDHQFAATGFAGNGMTFGTLGAMMAVDTFHGRRNPWAEIFDIKRKKLRGGTLTFFKENKDYPFYLVRDRLARSEGTSLRSLQRNQGRILNLRGHKVAAFRDEAGHVSLCSPVCTHLKCIVRWNEAERTWDCPCHGSRFKPTGEVLAGPAEEPLEKLPMPEQ